MFRSNFAVLFCAVLLVSGCATTSEQRLQKAMTDEDDPLVCEKTTVIGTRVAQRVCLRQSQIEARKRNSQAALDEVQKRGAISTKTDPQ